MTCEQGLLRLLWGGARSWSATALIVPVLKLFRQSFLVRKVKTVVPKISDNKTVIPKISDDGTAAQ